MDSLSQLLGSSTRARIVELLALSKKPLSAYRVSKMYNINTGKVYLEMKKLAGLGLVASLRGRRGVEYALIDENLRALSLKLSSRRVITYDEWRSPEAKAQRFRSGLIKPPKFPGVWNKATSDERQKSTRLPGELNALARLARSKFDKKYRRIRDREYARI